MAVVPGHVKFGVLTVVEVKTQKTLVNFLIELA